MRSFATMRHKDVSTDKFSEYLDGKEHVCIGNSLVFKYEMSKHIILFMLR